MPDIDIYIVLAQIINFGILLAVFHYFIGKKLTQNIEQRKIQLEKLRTAEEHYEQKMSLARQHKQELLDGARKTTAELMRESEIIVDQKAKNIISIAHKQALSILEGGKREVEKERRSMLVQMKSHILDVSLKLNEKMFGKNEANREYISEEIKKMNT
ncbi:hypothetical protein GW846_00620 [Candidatus Gracilibacteria bacterium]|nr:hypothetical protein [Candidatus Gracilibacteria bacterium]